MGSIFQKRLFKQSVSLNIHEEGNDSRDIKIFSKLMGFWYKHDFFVQQGTKANVDANGGSSK